MKNAYQTPTAEKIEFQYQEQVVASSQTCTSQWTNIGDDACQDVELVKNFSD